MTEHPAPSGRHQSGTYEIRIRGHLDARWAVTLGVSSLTHEADGITLLRGVALDQPALHGLLQRIRDLSLPLISINRVDHDQPNA
jgi:hypothetical protein